MKILGRIIIILAVFSVVVGAMVTVVNVVGNISGSDGPKFDGAPPLRPGGNEGDFRPEGNEGGSGGGLLRGINISRIFSGLVKDTVIVGVLVTAIVLPKSFFKKKKRTPKPGTENIEIE